MQRIAYTIVADIYAPTERARVQSLLSGVFGVAAIMTYGGDACTDPILLVPSVPATAKSSG